MWHFIYVLSQWWGGAGSPVVVPESPRRPSVEFFSSGPSVTFYRQS